MTRLLPFDLPWDTAQNIATDMTHTVGLLILGLILCIVAIIILSKVGGKWRIPGFLVFLVPGVLILGGYVQ